MEKTELRNLVSRYLAGKTTAEEEEYLLKYYDNIQKNNITWNAEEMGDEADVKDRLYSNALKEIEKREKSDRGAMGSLFLNWAYWKVAATIAIISAAAFYFYQKDFGQQIAKVKRKTTTVQNDVPPGGNKAILTLADGTEIVLDNADEGTLSTQGNIAVNKSKDGQLIYRINSDKQSAKPIFNTIKTPVGGQYQVILSDNTIVWLNASSSIKFPTAFNAKERYVEIEGEAYFEVAKDKKRPFRVSSGGQIIEVLGTHFNLNAYNDEEAIKTTLLEGSVKIVSGNENLVLRPGHQARVSRSNQTVKVVPVDTEEAAAWKNGLFMFDNEDIHSIMRKISRWYGVEVIYQDNNISETFGGTVSRFENVSQVLKILEVTGTIHFKIEGRRIIVMR